ncbi:MAG: hypothetical protein M0P57_13445 [Syntrophales bacterium]|jgi:hypothetical protein|nr:hypothetical protein [Syntrophales bacterium]MDY0045520.1 hypothetical protein [Syntrophales bacterium]
MAEIKSTLDIIMEKTRGMTLSDQEKKEIRLKEQEGKIKGLVERFSVGFISKSDFLRSLHENKTEIPSTISRGV